MLKPLIDDRIKKIFFILYSKGCSDILLNLEQPRFESELANIAKNIKSIIRRMENVGLLQSININNNRYLKRTPLGEYFSKILEDLENVFKGDTTMYQNKYKDTHIPTMMGLSFDEKILKVQGTLAKIFRDKKPIMDIYYNKNTIEYKLLSKLKNMMYASINIKIHNKPKHVLSPKLLCTHPEIASEWKRNGCYNKDGLTSYPLALLSEEECERYLQALERKHNV